MVLLKSVGLRRQVHGRLTQPTSGVSREQIPLAQEGCEALFLVGDAIGHAFFVGSAGEGGGLLDQLAEIFAGDGDAFVEFGKVVVGHGCRAPWRQFHAGLELEHVCFLSRRVCAVFARANVFAISVSLTRITNLKLSAHFYFG